MKTMLLLRHGKSSHDQPGLADHERILNERGEREVPRMAELLLSKELVPDRIVSSTAVRARDTARRIAKHCGYQGDVELRQELYLAPPTNYLRLAQTLSNDVKTVLFVGHNPGLEELVFALTGEHQHLATAALVQVVLKLDSWEELSNSARGKLKGFWVPKEL